MKKLCFILVSVVLSMAIMLTGCANKVAKVSIDDAKCSSGEYVDVKIKIDKNPGIWGGQIVIDYDYMNFTFISVTNGTVFETCESNDTGETVALLLTHKINASTQLEDAKQDGTIAILTFKVKTGASRGDHDITINADTNFCNANEELIEVSFEPGVIKVK